MAPSAQGTTLVFAVLPDLMALVIAGGVFYFLSTAMQARDRRDRLVTAWKLGSHSRMIDHISTIHEQSDS